MDLIPYLIVLAILAGDCFAADKSKWKTCDQSSFCRRHRKVEEGSSKYQLIVESVEQHGQSEIRAQLRHKDTGKALLLQLVAMLQDSSVVRMKLNDVDQSGRVRFEAKDALLENIPFGKITLGDVNENGFKATFGQGNRVDVTAFPFRVDVFSGNKLVISANHRGKLKWEHSRPKPESKLKSKCFR